MVLKCIVDNGVACCSMVVILFLWLMQVALAVEVFSLSAGSVWWLESSFVLVRLAVL